MADNQDREALENAIFGGSDSELSDDESVNEIQPVTQRSATPSSRGGSPARGGDGDDGAYGEEGGDEDDERRKLPKFKRERRAREGGEDGGAGERKKKAPKKKRPTRARSPAAGAERSASPEPPMDPVQRRREELNARIAAAAKGPKAVMRKRKRNQEEDLDAAADEEIVALRDRMMIAAELDEDANKARRPGTHKLKLLPSVVDKLQMQTLEASILENNLLEGVRRWLEPLPDKSLPALNIQKELFAILDKMFIDTQSLKASGLGRVVLFYTKHPHVSPPIKRTADGLVTKWSRPIIKRSASYKARQVTVASETIRARPVKRDVLEETDERDRHRRVVRIPTVDKKEYRVAPTRGVDGIAHAVAGVRTKQNERQRNFAKKLGVKGR